MYFKQHWILVCAVHFSVTREKWTQNTKSLQRHFIYFLIYSYRVYCYFLDETMYEILFKYTVSITCWNLIKIEDSKIPPFYLFVLIWRSPDYGRKILTRTDLYEWALTQICIEYIQPFRRTYIQTYLDIHEDRQSTFQKQFFFFVFRGAGNV